MWPVARSQSTPTDDGSLDDVRQVAGWWQRATTLAGSNPTDIVTRNSQQFVTGRSNSCGMQAIGLRISRVQDSQNSIYIDT